MSVIGEHEQQIVDRLNEERSEILTFGNDNSESRNRIEELDRKISEIVSGDTFRQHELDDGDVVDNIIHEANDLDTGFEGNSYGFVSQSFHDPDLDY